MPTATKPESKKKTGSKEPPESPTADRSPRSRVSGKQVRRIVTAALIVIGSVTGVGTLRDGHGDGSRDPRAETPARSIAAAGPRTLKLSADNQNPDGTMPAEDALYRIHDTTLEPDQYALIGVRNNKDTVNGTNLYFCGGVDGPDIACPGIKLGATRASVGPWTVMALVVDSGGKTIIDGLHGKPFLEEPRALLGRHLLAYGTTATSRMASE